MTAGAYRETTFATRSERRDARRKTRRPHRHRPPQTNEDIRRAALVRRLRRHGGANAGRCQRAGRRDARWRGRGVAAVSLPPRRPTPPRSSARTTTSEQTGGDHAHRLRARGGTARFGTSATAAPTFSATRAAPGGDDSLVGDDAWPPPDRRRGAVHPHRSILSRAGTEKPQAASTSSPRTCAGRRAPQAATA
jgi:hypothetical protein